MNTTLQEIANIHESLKFNTLLYFYDFSIDNRDIISDKERYKKMFAESKGDLLSYIESIIPSKEQCIKYTNIDTIEFTQDEIYINWYDKSFYMSTKQEAEEIADVRYDNDKSKSIENLLKFISSDAVVSKNWADEWFISMIEWFSECK